MSCNNYKVEVSNCQVKLTNLCTQYTTFYTNFYRSGAFLGLANERHNFQIPFSQIQSPKLTPENLILQLETDLAACVGAGGGGGAGYPAGVNSATGFMACLSPSGEQAFIQVLTPDVPGGSTYRIHRQDGTTSDVSAVVWQDCEAVDTGQMFQIPMSDDTLNDGTALVDFIRVVSMATDGTPTTIGDFELDLVTPYTVVGAASSRDVQRNDQVKLVSYIDDTLNNGSVLVEFVRLVSVGEDGKTTVLGDYLEDLITPYTVVGTAHLPEGFGTAAVVKQERVILNGVGTWSPTALVRSYSYLVMNVNDTLNPPTFTASSGAVSDLIQGESGTYPLDGEADLMDATAGITTNVGDVVIINYTTL